MYEECKVKLESQEREFRQSYELIVAENKVLRTEKMMMEQRMADMANQYGLLKTRYDSLDQNFNDLMEHTRSQGQGQGPLQGRLLVTRPANTNHANQTQSAQADLNVDRRNFHPNFSNANQNIGQNLRSNMNYTNQPKTNPTNAGFNTWLNPNQMAQNVQNQLHGSHFSQNGRQMGAMAHPMMHNTAIRSQVPNQVPSSIFNGQTILSKPGQQLASEALNLHNRPPDSRSDIPRRVAELQNLNNLKEESLTSLTTNDPLVIDPDQDEDQLNQEEFRDFGNFIGQKQQKNTNPDPINSDNSSTTSTNSMQTTNNHDVTSNNSSVVMQAGNVSYSQNSTLGTGGMDTINIHSKFESNPVTVDSNIFITQGGGEGNVGRVTDGLIQELGEG